MPVLSAVGGLPSGSRPSGSPRRMIWGRISSAGAVVSGTGFTATRTGTGLYTIVFLVPFPRPPAMQFQVENFIALNIVTPNTGASGVLADKADVVIGQPGTAARDAPFNFLAIEI